MLKSSFIVATVVAATAVAIGLAGQSSRSVETTAPNAGRVPKLSSRAKPPKPFNMDNLTIPAEQLLSGGPPKDGIPALVNPHAVPVAKADFLKPSNRVIGVSLGGQDRAYPINILNWHEIINDQLGGVPIAIIYCPLCDSVSVVDRRIGGQTLTFGVSGLLYNSNVVFYDRTHQSLWSQVGLTALSGPYAGQSLKHLAWELRPFGRWKKDHPQGTVATFETGHVRDYRRNPYSSYFRTDKLMFPVARSDDRLRPKTVVVAVKIGATARAYPLERIAQAKDGRIMDTVAGHRVVLRVDAVTRGVVVEEIPPGAKVIHTFWFAWAAFHPDTDIYGSKPSVQGQTLPAEGAKKIPAATVATGSLCGKYRIMVYHGKR